jgi:hypothetical protein
LFGFSGAKAAIPCTPGAVVRYVNGINNPNEQVVSASADLLRDRLNRGEVSCISEVVYLFNPSDGVIADIIQEVALQKVAEFGVSFADALLIVHGAVHSYTPFGILESFFLTDDEITATRLRVLAHVQKAFLDGFSFTLNAVEYKPGELIEEFRDKVILDLSRGTKVVLVSHSQGNLFANATFTAVQGTSTASLYRGLSIVNVANAAIEAPSDLYITSFQDLVVSLLGRAAMPSNISAGFSQDDLSGHSLERIYLSTLLPVGSASQDSMAGRVSALVQTALDQSSAPAGSIIASTFSSLVRIDLITRTAQILGPFTSGKGSLSSIFDIAINPQGGSAIAIFSSSLSSFDPALRRLSVLPQSSLGGNALTFNADGELFAMSGNRFYQIDPLTGEVIGTPLDLPFSYTSSGDLTFDQDGNLYGTAIAPNGQDALIKVDTVRNQISIIGNIGYAKVWGLYFSGGILYGATSNGTLISIDRSTGSGSLVTKLNVSEISGLQ